jgi:hypothetical protein
MALFALAMAATCLVAAEGVAQGGRTTGTVPKPSLTADKETIVKDFVAQDKPIPVKTAETPEVGGIAPNGVELLPLGSVGARVPELARLKYFLGERNTIVLVNPDNREIAYVVK